MIRPTKTVERIYPLAFGFLAGYIYFRFHPVLPITQNFTSLLNSIISVSAIAVGFLATTKAVLFSIEEKRVIRLLKSRNHYYSLIDYFIKAIWLLIVLALASGLLLLCDVSGSGWRIPLSAWAGLTVWASSACFRAIHLFTRVIRLHAEES